MRQGLLVTFSGIDNSGKSTQIKLLHDYLEEQGMRPICLWTRGGYTSFFNRIKKMLRHLMPRSLPPPGDYENHDKMFQNKWMRCLWIGMALLDLTRVYGLQIRFWRLKGRPVLCDRYIEDTWVDLKIKFPNECVEKWWLWRLLLRVTPKPDMKFLLMIPIEESVRRSHVKKEPFPDTPRALAKRVALYQRLSASSDWHILNGEQSKESIFQDILRSIETNLRLVAGRSESKSD